MSRALSTHVQMTCRRCGLPYMEDDPSFCPGICTPCFTAECERLDAYVATTTDSPEAIAERLFDGMRALGMNLGQILEAVVNLMAKKE